VHVGDWSCLDPLGELVDCHEEMSEALRHLSEWPQHVEVPHSKRPDDGDCLARLRREVSLSSIELAPLVMPYCNNPGI
jgi:hypothetical protein